MSDQEEPAGEPGPEEIRAAGGGLSLVAAGDVAALAARIDELLGDEALLRAEGEQARETVRRAFSWDQCAIATVAAYEQALRDPGPRP